MVSYYPRPRTCFLYFCGISSPFPSLVKPTTLLQKCLIFGNLCPSLLQMGVASKTYTVRPNFTDSFEGTQPLYRRLRLLPLAPFFCHFNAIDVLRHPQRVAPPCGIMGLHLSPRYRCYSLYPACVDGYSHMASAPACENSTRIASGNSSSTFMGSTISGHHHSYAVHSAPQTLN